MRLRDLFEDFIVDGEPCFILSQWLDTELLEEDDLDLFRGIEIEELTDHIIDLDFIFPYLFMDTLSDFLEFRTITSDSSILHLCEDREKSRFHLSDEV